MVQQYFLEYLLADEQKQEAMLNKLHSIKDGMNLMGDKWFQMVSKIVVILFFQIFKTSFNFSTTLTLIVENHLIEFYLETGIIQPFLLLNEKK